MDNKPQLTQTETIDKFFPIYFYRRHLDIAARDILGLNLAPHHAVIIRSWGRSKYAYLLCGRGMGKSVLMAIYFVLCAILYPKNKLLAIGGKGFRQSKSLMLEMEKITLNRLSSQKDYGYVRFSLQDYKKVINKDPSFWAINFGNGSQIMGVPLGDGSQIRGIRAYSLGLDEAFLLPSSFVQEILEPFLNVLADPTKKAEEQRIKNQSIRTSTIDFSFRSFYKEFKHFEAILREGAEVVIGQNTINSEDISLFEFNFEDTFYVTYKGERKTLWGLDVERILQARDSDHTDLDVWLAENKNQPQDLSGGYFDFSHIEKCSEVVLRERDDLTAEPIDSCSMPHVLGVDTAPSGANSAFVAVKAGSLKVDTRDVAHCKIADLGSPCPYLGKGNSCLYRKYNTVSFAHEANKMTQRQRVQLIYELYNKYNLLSIGMDARGGGLELADLLQDVEYILEVAGEGNKPIYDPERTPNGIGLPILKLYATTQELNLIFNSYLKALLANGQLLLPKPDRGRNPNQRLHTASGHIETLVNQLARIKAVEAGKSVKFIIETTDAKTGKPTLGNKDLYSALLYACARIRELVQDENEQNRYTQEELAVPIPFRM